MDDELKFQKIVFTVDGCAAEDVLAPVVVELTSRGDLVFHNWDRDADEAALALGFPIEDVPCTFMEDLWHDAFDEAPRNRLDALPPLLRDEARRILDFLNTRMYQVLEKARYRPPKGIVGGRFGYMAELMGLNPTGSERITGRVDERILVVGVKGQVGRADILKLTLFTTAQAFLDVLRFVPSGHAYDRKNKTIVVVVAIEEFIGDDKILVRAGRQNRDLSVKTSSAIIVRASNDPSKWVVKEWL